MRRLAAILLLILSFPLQAGEGLPPVLAAAMRRAQLPDEALSLVVMPLEGGQGGLGFNAAQPKNPASLMKLLTTYAALDLLGPAWQWTTELGSPARPANGILSGDLYLRGSGDPKLTLERVWLLLRELKQQGVDEIRGDLVLDRSRFVSIGLEPVFDDDGNNPEKPYLVGPDALLANFKSLRLTLDSTQEGVLARLDPSLPEVRLDSRLRAGPPGDCELWHREVTMQVNDQGSHAALSLGGAMPSGCTGERHLAMLEHPVYTASLVRLLWQELGGVWNGSVREAAMPAQTPVLARTRSPELPLVVRDINKFSNNVMARQLFMTLGAELGLPEDGTETANRAEAVIRRWLAARNWDWPELAIANGSGLSREARVSPEHLAMLLRDAARSPLSAEFIASLPVVAMDGTMKKRLRDDPVAGQAHIKTGSLRDVRALAGYVRAPDGQLHVVVAMIQHPRAREGSAVLDEVLRWVYSKPVYE